MVFELIISSPYLSILHSVPADCQHLHSFVRKVAANKLSLIQSLEYSCHRRVRWRGSWGITGNIDCWTDFLLSEEKQAKEREGGMAWLAQEECSSTRLGRKRSWKREQGRKWWAEIFVTLHVESSHARFFMLLSTSCTL